VCWIVSGSLVAVCCLLVTRITNDLRRMTHPPKPPPIALAADATPTQTPSWSDREIIIERDLFDASAWIPPEPEPAPPPVEEIEPTELPLGLLGTVSSDLAEDRSAALWDAQARDSVVVGEDDPIAGGLARVVRIERERILLAENGTIRELVLDDDSEFQPPPARPPRRARKRSAPVRPRNARMLRKRVR